MFIVFFVKIFIFFINKIIRSSIIYLLFINKYSILLNELLYFIMQCFTILYYLIYLLFIYKKLFIYIELYKIFLDLFQVII